MKYQIFTFLFISIVLTSCFKKDNELVIDTPNSVTAVQSNCTANQTIKNIYTEDAHRLALRATLANNGSSWQDSVRINPVLTNDILGGLLALHNGTSMIYRDTVIAVYGIHTFENPMLQRMLIKVDTSLVWVQRLRAGNLYTTNDNVDQMINMYGLEKVDYNEYPNGNYITLESSMFLNIKALGEKFEVIDGVFNAQIDAISGDGNEITYSYNSSEGYQEFIYSAGYKNCPTGCEKRRFWKFYVRDVTCTLEFRGSWGDLAP